MPGSNEDILRVLGRVEEKVDGVGRRLDRFEEEFGAERRSSSESRHRIHERIDEQAHKIGEAEKTIVAAGAIAAQQRDIIVDLTKTIQDDIKPTLEEWNRLKTLGWGMRVVLVSAGVSVGTFGAAFWWFGEAMRPVIRKFFQAD
ncbi:MAG: DUF1515 domain-containing protein [Allorhizobium sp.]